MAKKFFDIIPPNLASDIGTKVKDFIVGEKTKKKGEKKVKRSTSLRLKRILISSGVFVVLLIIYLYFKLASLDVGIWPKTELITFEQKITAEESINEIDLQNKKIPAQFIEEEKELWQEFPATGSSSKEGIAEGTIRVYNKYSPPKSFTLVAKTRFLSDSGKLFRAVSKINLPPAQVKNGKIIPSWVDVKVVAVESGEAYNIGPAKFSVPGLSGTPSYYSVYAESTNKMAGGYESKLKVVTAEDIDDAKNNLTQKLLNDTEEALKNKTSSSDLILFDNAITKDVIEASSSVKAGAEVDKFNYKIKVKISALVFKEPDLRKITKDYILSQISESKTILEKSLDLNYVPETIDLKAGKMVLNLKISTKIYPIVDKQAMSLSFMGKSSNDISDIIYSELNQQVDRLKVNLWPFWVKKAPKKQNKIKIELNFE